jgi:hypothetical protein
VTAASSGGAALRGVSVPRPWGVVVLALAALSFGCAGTETGNPPSAHTVSLALVLVPTTAPTAGEVDDDDDEAADEAPPYSSIDSAWLATETLELRGCVGADQAEWPALAWDLVQPVAHGRKTQISEFCGVQLRTQAAAAEADAGSIPQQLAGAGLWIRATRKDGTAVEVTGTAQLDLSQTSAVPLPGPQLTFAFDPAAWFKGVDLNGLTPDADGVIRISSASNPTLLQVFEGQIGEGSVLRPRELEDEAEDDTENETENENED